MQAALLADDKDQVWEAAQEWAREREAEQWAQARREAEPAVVASPPEAAAGAATVAPSPLEVPPADVAAPPDAAAGAATVAPSAVVRRSHTRKGPPRPEDPPPQAADDEVRTGHLWKRQYSGTWSHTTRLGSRAPQDMDKAAFGELLVRLLTENFRSAAASAKRAKLNRVLRASVFEEKHVSGKLHYHFPVLADYPWSYGPLSRALRAEGIYVDFSMDHDYYWTSVVYVAVPSAMPQGKQEADLDQEPWLSPGHPPIRDLLEDMPRGARSSDKARVRRYLGICHETPRASKDVSLTDKEFVAHVVQKDLQTTTDLLAWVQTRASALHALPVDERLLVIGMQAYCYKNQGDLQRRLAFAWQMQEAPRIIRERDTSAWAAVLAAADNAGCVCGGQWIPLTEELLQIQCQNLAPSHPQKEAPRSVPLRQAMIRCLQEGCQKHCNVYLYGRTTSGKSHVLKPLMTIFGDETFTRPAGKSTYPLQDLFGKKLCVLQDLRVNTFKIGFDSLLVWFEGESFPVPRPQNRHDGDKLYKERAPIFVSSGAKLRIQRDEAERLELDEAEQNRMMDSRFCFFHFPHSFTGDTAREMPACPKCFAQWLRETPAPMGAASEGATVPLVAPVLASAPLPTPPLQHLAPVSVSAPALPPPTAPVLPVGAVVVSPPLAPAALQGNVSGAAMAILQGLRELAAMHREGSLDAVEFTAAKRQLLQLSGAGS